MSQILNTSLAEFQQYPSKQEEKSQATLEKYLGCSLFFAFLNRDLQNETIAYKGIYPNYAPASVNSMLVALNIFLRFMGMQNYCVKLLKIQRQIFCGKKKTHSAGIQTFGKSSARHQTVVYHSNSLRHRDSCQRTQIYYGGSLFLTGKKKLII